jgi:hypothetical protein
MFSEYCFDWIFMRMSENRRKGLWVQQEKSLRWIHLGILIVEDCWFSESKHFIMFLVCTYIDLWESVSRNVFRIIDSKEIVEHKPFSPWKDRLKGQYFKASKIMLLLVCSCFLFIYLFILSTLRELIGTLSIVAGPVPRIWGYQLPMTVLSTGPWLLSIWFVPASTVEHGS